MIEPVEVKPEQVEEKKKIKKGSFSSFLATNNEIELEEEEKVLF
jgi:hypothetical protein